MSEWRTVTSEHLTESPITADPAERLQTELLALKEDSGLSFARLGARTHYAKSSWERWVNGKQFPPRAAVESLALALERDPAPLLELWDLADQARSSAADQAEAAAGEAAAEPGSTEAPRPEATAAASTEPAAQPSSGEQAAEPAPPAEDAARKPGWRRPLPLALAACAVLGGAVLALAGTGLLHFGPGHRPAPVVASPSPSPSVTPSTQAKPIGCTGAGCNGKDPMAMGCSLDGQTLGLTRNQDMVIELRYSKACSAVWGRITYTVPNAVVDVGNSDGVAEASPVHWGNDAYSPMAELSAKQTAWACGTQPDGQARSCTPHTPAP